MWLRPPNPDEHWTLDEQATLIHEWARALADAGFTRTEALYLVSRMLPKMRLDWPPGFDDAIPPPTDAGGGPPSG